MEKLWGLRYHSVIRYGLIGFSAFVSQYIVLSISYYLFSVPLHIASSLGYIAGLLISYSFNRHWVFGAAGKHKHIVRQSAQYVELVIFNYFFTVVGISFLNKHGVPPYVGQFPITILITIWNYNLFKRVIFKGKPAETTTSY